MTSNSGSDSEGNEIEKKKCGLHLPAVHCVLVGKSLPAQGRSFSALFLYLQQNLHTPFQTNTKHLCLSVTTEIILPNVLLRHAFCYCSQLSEFLS